MDASERKENRKVGVAMISPDLEVLAVNRRMQEWFPALDLAKRPLCYRAFDTPLRDEACGNCTIFKTMEDGQSHEAEMERPTPDGIRQYRIVLTPLLSSDGGVTAAIEMVEDITEQKQAETALLERESQIKAIADSARDAIIMLDHKGVISYWNPMAENIFGYMRAEAIGRNLHECIAPQRYHEAHHAAFPEFQRTGKGAAVGKTLELQACRKDGQEITVALSLSSVQIKGAWHAVGIVRDITDQKKAEEKLYRTLEKLEQVNGSLEAAIARANEMAVGAQAANIAKSQFLANMSHEIRTPMNGVIGMTGLLLDTDLSEEQRHYCETVRASGEALLDVINDILDFSKIEAGKIGLEELDFDIRAILEDTVELLALRAHEKHLEFTCRIDPKVHTFLRGDPGRLRQILVNLGGNAIKFTSHGEVAFDVQLAEEKGERIKVRFEVRDTGIGIPQDKIELLFSAFQQLDASTTRRFGGTGLGLAISKRLVELMGGCIGVESVEGQGSTFWFTSVFARQQSGKRDEAPLRADIRGVRILAVDDNATNRLILSEQLASWGVRHSVAGSALEALEMLRAACNAGDPYRIAVTDMQMPDMDGESLAVAIKADTVLKDTLLIMMTSLGKRGDARRIDAMGFSAYLIKPVKQSQLYDCLSTILGSGVHTVKTPDISLATLDTLSEARRLKVRILLVEDNVTNQQVALRILEKLGFRADAVGNGREAIEALERAPYDIVFMDVQMPVMDGFEATRAIRTGQTKVPNPELPIVAMTAHAMKGDRERCIEAGMDDYIAKPVTPQALSEALDKWLGRALEPQRAAPASPENREPFAGPPIFDRQALEDRLMGDKELAREICAGFLKDMSRQMQELRQHIDQSNAALSGGQSHTIRGAAANVGGMALSAVALHMEKAANDGRWNEMEPIMSEMERQFDLLKTRMEENLS
jgi:PAS domain S-box-containing protein